MIFCSALACGEAVIRTHVDRGNVYGDHHDRANVPEPRGGATGGLRGWGRWLIALAMLAVCVGPLERRALAQDEQPSAAASADAPGGEVKKKEVQSAFSWFLETIGLIGYFIFGLSIYFVSLVGRMFVELRQQVAMPPETVDETDSLLQQRQFKEVYSVVKDDDSFYSRVLAVGIAELPNGLAEARDAMERQGEALTGEMERKISMMAVLGSLGPMIGLLGTLKGMIASFGEIARSGTQLKADEVAKGISEALLLTLLGVGLSVPAIYFYAIFRNRVTGISSKTMLAADEFLRHFAHAARSKAPATAAPVQASAKPPGK